MGFPPIMASPTLRSQVLCGVNFYVIPRIKPTGSRHIAAPHACLASTDRLSVRGTFLLGEPLRLSMRTSASTPPCDLPGRVYSATALFTSKELLRPQSFRITTHHNDRLSCPVFYSALLSPLRLPPICSPALPHRIPSLVPPDCFPTPTS